MLLIITCDINCNYRNLYYRYHGHMLIPYHSWSVLSPQISIRVNPYSNKKNLFLYVALRLMVTIQIIN